MTLPGKYGRRCLAAILIVLALGCLLLILLGHKTFRPGLKDQARANGLRTPTPSERQTEQQLVPVENDVTLNALALERINAERKAQGLPPLQAKAAAPGHEIDATVPATNAVHPPHP
jgi:hypothetical protein